MRALCFIFAADKNNGNMEKVDKLDLKILGIISQNARIPFKDVAEECGVSRAAIHQRVQRLIKLGVITGSGYHVDPRAVNFSTCAFVNISLERASMCRQVATELEKIPEIVECHFSTGHYMLFVKVYCKDNEHLKNLLGKSIQSIEGVKSTETFISLEQTFTRTISVPVPEEEKKTRQTKKK